MIPPQPQLLQLLLRLRGEVRGMLQQLQVRDRRKVRERSTGTGQGRWLFGKFGNFQKTWKLLIPAATFIRTVKEISNFFAPGVTRWTAESLVALQEAAEVYLVQLFEDAMLCAIHAKRVTLMKKDWVLARRLGGKGQPWREHRVFNTAHCYVAIFPIL